MKSFFTPPASLENTPRNDSNYITPVVSPNHERNARLLDPRSVIFSSRKLPVIHHSIFKLIYKSPIYNLFIAFLILFNLFGTNINQIVGTKSTDSYKNYITILLILCFTWDIALNGKVSKVYLLRVLFWIDVISAVTLIFDIDWITDHFKVSVSLTGIGYKLALLFRSARAARFSGRFSLLYRGLTIKKQIKLVSAYTRNQSSILKLNVKQKSGSDISDLISAVDLNQQKTYNIKMAKQSKLGKQLITKSSILLLLLIFVLNGTSLILSLSFYENKQNDITFALQQMNKYSLDETYPNLYDTPKLFLLEDHNGTSLYPLIQIHAGKLIQTNEYIGKLRNNEKCEYSVGSFKVIYSIRHYKIIESIIEIVMTLLILIVLIFGSIFITKNIYDMVINPLERISNRINSISIDPIEEIRKAESEFLALMYQKELNKKSCSSNKDSEIKSNMILEKSIVNIGSLLRLCYGTAGSNTISDILKTGKGKLSLNSKGVKVYSILGFIKIQNFSVISEKLKEDAITFANDVALIVHKYVHMHLGNINKNMGDSFLVTWNFNSDNLEERSKYTVLVLLAVLSIVRKLNTSTKLKAKYSDIPEIVLHYGFHVGWAIEGAVGSKYKLECSYLSPNVNLASRLESASKQYHVLMLVSDQYLSYLPEQALPYFVLLDRVELKGSSKPIELWTANIQEDVLEEMTPPTHKKSNNSFKTELKRLTLMEAVKQKEYDIFSTMLLKNKKVKNYLVAPKGDNPTIFNAGIQLYLQGKWKEAYEQLCQVENYGPAGNIISYIKSHSIKAPENWNKCRKLDEK